MSDEIYSTSAIIEHKTDKAILIKAGGDDIWLPLSQIKIDGETADADEIELLEVVEIEMPEWLAKKKGLF